MSDDALLTELEAFGFKDEIGHQLGMSAVFQELKRRAERDTPGRRVFLELTEYTDGRVKVRAFHGGVLDSAYPPATIDHVKNKVLPEVIREALARLSEGAPAAPLSNQPETRCAA